MKTFKIENGDLVFDAQNNLIMVEDEEEQAQAIERILTTNINEWFLNLDHGLDYQAIQGKGKDKESIKLAIIEAIMQEDRVDTVKEIDVEIDKFRHIKVNAEVRIKSGDTLDLSEVIDIG